MCVRQFQNRIDDSVYTLLKNRIGHFNFEDRFQVLRTTIHSSMGSQFIFYGLWRHIEEIKSTEDVDILWIEEGHHLTKEQWDILEPTIRKEGSQIWLIFNPRLATDFAYKRFVLNPPPNTIVRKINYDENPFLSQTMRDVIEAKRAESEDDYNHVYLGMPRDDDDAVFIKRSWLLAAIDAHRALGFDPSGKKRLGFDVADDGEDKNADCLLHGNVILESTSWKGGENELPKSARRVHSKAQEHDAEVSYDSIGVGAFVGGYFEEIDAGKPAYERVKHVKFNAASAVINPDKLVDPRNPKSATNKDHYANRKAQAWGDAARRFQITYNAVRHGADYDEDQIISLSSDIEDLDGLIDELSAPFREEDGRGKTKVESKDDMKKRDVLSPNRADAAIAVLAPQEVAKAAAGLFMSSNARGL